MPQKTQSESCLTSNHDCRIHAEPLQEYLRILHTAARESETLVDECLRWMIDEETAITADAVRDLVLSEPDLSAPRQVHITEPDLGTYDQLLSDAWHAAETIITKQETPACL